MVTYALWTLYAVIITVNIFFIVNSLREIRAIRKRIRVLNHRDDWVTDPRYVEVLMEYLQGRAPWSACLEKYMEIAVDPDIQHLKDVTFHVNMGFWRNRLAWKEELDEWLNSFS